MFQSTKILRSVSLEDTFLPINLQMSSKNDTNKLLGYCVRENIDSLSILTFCKYFNAFLTYTFFDLLLELHLLLNYLISHVLNEYIFNLYIIYWYLHFFFFL